MSESLETVREIARKLSCSQETVRRMLRAKEVPGVKIRTGEWRANFNDVVLALSQDVQPRATRDH